MNTSTTTVTKKLHIKKIQKPVKTDSTAQMPGGGCLPLNII